MIENLAQNNIPPEVLSAIREQEKAQKECLALSPHILELSQKTARILLSWELPAAAIAVLLAPLLELNVATTQSLAETFDQKSVNLARRLADWRSSSETLDEPTPDASPTQYSMQLRRLLRLAYLDLSDLSFVLILMANHDVHLSLMPQGFAAQTEAVFVPLAGILGMWELRRRWLDRSISILHPNEYIEFAKLVEETGPSTQKKIREQLSNENGMDKSIDTAVERKKREEGGKMARRRSQVFIALKDRLTKYFQEADFEPLPAIQLIEPYVGSYLYRYNQGESKEEIAQQLRVRLLCKAIPDCYRALGIIHSLAKPVTLRYSERFGDYIASPMANGYRAIHTTVVYGGDKDSSEEMEGKIPIDFRILTHEMHRMNERGILETIQSSSPSGQSGMAWWNRLEENSDKFSRRQKLLLMDFGTRSDPVYVFTPQGEVFQQKDGSTALDFAYSVHTELGHHAAKIEVNSKPVLYNYPLRNGDLVRILHSRHFSGPDWSWLECVSTPQARSAIRQELMNRAREIHAGRGKIEQILMKLVQYYKKERGYDLLINTELLDAFLWRSARVRGLPGVESLYSEVEIGELSAQKLVDRLISEELAVIIVDANGGPVPYLLNHISLCNICHPVPGDPLIAFEYRVNARAKGLKVHRECDQNCIRHAKQGKLVLVRWAEQTSSADKCLLQFQIGCEDRYGLLGDIINLVYAEPDTYLRSAETRTYSDGGADITLVVEAETLAQLAELHARLETVHSVRRVFSFYPSPSQRLALKPALQKGQFNLGLTLKSSLQKDQSNPYTYQEVYDRLMFYDREAYISTILKWLREPVPTKPLILHGQRRVGKTSLAKYVMYEILPQQHLAQAIWIDFQDLSQFSAQNIANCFVQSVYEALQKPIPHQQAWEEPMLWLNRALEEAVKQLRNHRLLIILDEFNVLLDMERRGHLDPIVFSNLRSILSKRRDLNWFLLVQDTHFRDPDYFESAGTLFQQSPTLQLTHLDPLWANKLITEPAERSGIQYEDAVSATILDLTDGNPFLIQVLCYELLKRAMKQERTNITGVDLDQVVNLITSVADGPRIFHHFVNYLGGIQKIVLTAVAHSPHSREWVDVSEIMTQLQRREKRLRQEALYNALELLERKGMLALRGNAHSEQVSIPIKLFQKYVEDCMDLKTAIEEWRGERALNTRRYAHGNP
jgi:guanosine-3',5'-bis(diphosphate) 3'-pyrophosphohydrolase